MREKWPDCWYMAGTEGTGDYEVVVLTGLGRLGYRALDHGSFRIRVEPTDLGRASLSGFLTPTRGWKQPSPGGQDRYSLVVEEARLLATLDFAIRALDPGQPGTVVNRSTPERDQRIVDKVVRESQQKSAHRPVRRQVFFSYSHKDQKWLDHFQTMLKPAMQPEMLWDDTKIGPGQKWKEEIRKSLRSARVAVLLVSPHFLASDFIRKNELAPILKAENDEGLTVLWVPVRASMYEDTEIAKYQALGEPSRPLESLSVARRNRALVEICQKIKAAAETPPSPSLTINSQDQSSNVAAAIDEVAAQDLRLLAHPNIFVEVRVDRQNRSVSVTMSNRGAYPFKIDHAEINLTADEQPFRRTLRELCGGVIVASGDSARTREFLNNTTIELDSGAFEDWVRVDFV